MEQFHIFVVKLKDSKFISIINILANKVFKHWTTVNNKTISSTILIFYFFNSFTNS